MPKQPAWISLGANLGESKNNLHKAWERLGEHPQIFLLRLSSPWRTAPVEMESTNWFTNAVGKLETELKAEALLQVLLDTEKEFGRMRSSTTTSYQDRELDLDLLFFGEDGEVRKSNFLTLPHPQIGKRLFVLLPLQEIEPKWRNPHNNQTVGEMIFALENSGMASKQYIETDHW